MAKLGSSSSNGKKNNGIKKLMQKGLFLTKKRSESFSGQETVPKDVKEGHFAVIASDDYNERKFIVPIAYLRCPSFLRLLERAAEEYGFDHEGALMIPCPPSELQWILEEQMGSQEGGDWNSCKTMVESC
ncbi:auxin-responsive protein SAUR50-like [Cynara cardunculus var. scolymus]|uniref:Auxin responsive SAUR protein n=1 Tax=Cynara cardunculus var. scolymus TaxID=59895 RepID=A0A103Y058_CYNCS|nr:auxin-responsive protein SAUR50-like [Cynara cardunculus var. scolymus]KVI00099.1 Auxin responsive SAUR protein [Cynara cardunculus var. scolymus]